MDPQLLYIFQLQVLDQCECAVQAHNELVALLAHRVNLFAELQSAKIPRELPSEPAELAEVMRRHHEDVPVIRDQLVTVERRCWHAIQALLTANANLSKLLWGQGGKWAEKREPLRISLSIKDSSPLREVDMRNHFDHFDDRIDTWWESSPHHYMDMVISGGEPPPAHGLDDKALFRHFNPNTGELFFWGKRFSVVELAHELQRVLPVVSSAVAEGPPRGPSIGGGGQ